MSQLLFHCRIDIKIREAFRLNAVINDMRFAVSFFFSLSRSLFVSIRLMTKTFVTCNRMMKDSFEWF